MLSVCSAQCTFCCWVDESRRCDGGTSEQCEADEIKRDANTKVYFQSVLRNVFVEAADLC